MKIAIVAPEVLPIPPIKGGAVETWIDEVINCLPNSFELHCFSIFADSLLKYEKINNINHYRFKVGLLSRLLTSTYKLPFKRENSSLLWLPYSLWVAIKLWKIKADIIHIHNRIQFVSIIRFFNPRAKILLHIHQLSVFVPKKMWSRAVLSKIDLCVACSKFLEIELKENGVSAKAATYIYNGYNPNEFVPFWLRSEERVSLRKKFSISDGERAILYVGRIAENKGVHLLLEAFLDLSKRHANIKLVIAGGATVGDEKSKSYFEKLQETAIRFGGGKVIFSGKIKREDINKYYLLSDILVIPSIVKEGLPLVLLEAMASGLPVIVSNKGGLPELIEHGENGLILSDVENPNVLRSAINELIGDDELRFRLGKNAHEYVKTEFTWEAIASNVSKIYNRVASQKTVLLYEPSSGFGGSSSALVSLVNNLDEGKFNKVVIIKECGSQTEKIKNAEIIKLDDYGDTVGMSYPFLLFHFFLRVLPEALQIFLIIKEKRITFLHVNTNIISGIPAIIAAKIAGVHCICHIRQTRKLIRIEKFFAEYVDKFILINNDALAVYSKDIPAKKLVVIHDGVEIANFADSKVSPIREEFNLNSDFVAGLVGRIVEGKGQKEFILAGEVLIKSNPKVKFMIIGDAKGGSDEYYREVKGLVNKKELSKNIIFTGWRDDIANIIKGLDVVVQGSTTFPEGFGLTCIEAMALRKPVVATNIPGPRDIVVDGETGFLVEPGNPVALSEAILKLLDNPELARQMGEAGRKRAEELFSIKKNVKQIEAVYEELLGKAY